MKSYLENRSQSVKVGSNTSQPVNIVRGVPQGSILGPLLFTLYTSDFCKQVSFCNIHMYADDTQLYCSFRKNDMENATNKINQDLASISRFAQQHALLLNPSKSCALFLGRNIDKNELAIPALKIGNAEIPFVDNAKNLGLIIDKSFRFKGQISKNIQKAYLNLKLLYPHRLYLNVKVKTLLCEALVLSHFAYCSPVYGPCLDYETTQRIQRVQNTCLRFIYGIPKFAHISHKLSDARWLNMTNRRYLQSAILFHKIISEEKPPYLYNKISFRTDVHNINLRHRGLITIPQHNTSTYQRSFGYNIAKVYNNIPQSLKKCSTKQFKKRMFDHLLQLQ